MWSCYVLRGFVARLVGWLVLRSLLVPVPALVSSGRVKLVSKVPPTVRVCGSWSLPEPVFGVGYHDGGDDLFAVDAVRVPQAVFREDAGEVGAVDDGVVLVREVAFRQVGHEAEGLYVNPECPALSHGAVSAYLAVDGHEAVVLCFPVVLGQGCLGHVDDGDLSVGCDDYGVGGHGWLVHGGEERVPVHDVAGG